MPFGGADSDFTVPLFSLPVGEGTGALLAAAAGDVAGGAAPNGYSAITQAATVVAYHAIQVAGVQQDRLVRDLLALDGTEDGIRCYRGESALFRGWLDSVHAGAPQPAAESTSEFAGWMTALGVWFRNDPVSLVEAALGVARLISVHAPSVVAAAAVAGAVAGSCFVQSGRDLVYGAAETAEEALGRLVGSTGMIGMDEAEVLPRQLRSLAAVVAGTPREIVGSIAADNGPRGHEGALLAILLGASKLNEPVKLIEAGAMSGGSDVGAIVGGVVGARSGLVRWPWRIPNDTWFAEIGRRLVNHVSEVRDLPVPFAVEERLTLAIRDYGGDEIL